MLAKTDYLASRKQISASRSCDAAISWPSRHMEATKVQAVYTMVQRESVRPVLRLLCGVEFRTQHRITQFLYRSIDNQRVAGQRYFLACRASFPDRSAHHDGSARDATMQFCRDYSRGTRSSILAIGDRRTTFWNAQWVAEKNLDFW